MNLRLRQCMLLLALALPCAARADIGIVLNSSIGEGGDWFTNSGHSSIYLSRICPETPVRARMCAPGEMGSVLSAYSNFHEDKPYEWNLIPVSVFLYGVDNPADRPLYATQDLLTALRQNYRAQHLAALCATEDCRANPDANWIDTVGATFVRTVYIFEIKTTEAQDRAFVDRLNASANVNHYSGLDWNCADFAKDIINSYFPHAVRADRWNDFGMTSPKAIAKSLTHYADHHKQATGLRITRFEQLPSNIHRSDPARIGTESLFTQKKYMIPLLWRPEELAFFSASYALTGRFSAERAVRRHEPDSQLAALEDVPAPPAYAAPWQSWGWNQFHAGFAQLENEARGMGLVRSDGDVNRALMDLDKTAAPFLDSAGRPWMDIRPAPGRLADFSVSTIVGITPETVDTSRDRQAAALAYKLQLARVRFYLHSSGMNRESLAEFQQDWSLLEATRKTFLTQDHAGAEAVTAENGAETPPRGQ